MPRRALALALLLAAISSLVVFVLSFAGHPPYLGIGIAILPVSLGMAVALIWAALVILRARTKAREQ